MNKADLVASVADRAGISKRDSEKTVNAVLDAIGDALRRGEKVSLVGFGTFEVRSRAARVGRNPQTGAEIQIPATKVPVFRPGKALRDAVE